MPDEIVALANEVLGDWDDAMGRFFERVDRKRFARGLSSAETREALDRGYGEDIGDAWAAWVGDES